MWYLPIALCSIEILNIATCVLCRFRGTFTIGEKSYPSGDGKNKKEAKENGARQVIKVLQKEGAIGDSGKLMNLVSAHHFIIA